MSHVVRKENHKKDLLMSVFEFIVDWSEKLLPLATIIIGIAMFVVTFIYVRYTLAILRESSRPEIVVYVKKLISNDKNMYQLWFENVGKGTALNISTDPDLKGLSAYSNAFLRSYGKSISSNDFYLPSKSKIFFPVDSEKIEDLQEITISYQSVYKKPFKYSIKVTHDQIANRRDEFHSITEILKEILSVYDGSRWFLETMNSIRIKHRLTKIDIERLKQINQGFHLMHSEEGDDRLLEIYEQLSDHDKNMLFSDIYG